MAAAFRHFDRVGAAVAEYMHPEDDFSFVAASSRRSRIGRRRVMQIGGIETCGSHCNGCRLRSRWRGCRRGRGGSRCTAGRCQGGRAVGNGRRIVGTWRCLGRGDGRRGRAGQRCLGCGRAGRSSRCRFCGGAAWCDLGRGRRFRRHRCHGRGDHRRRRGNQPYAEGCRRGGRNLCRRGAAEPRQREQSGRMGASDESQHSPVDRRKPLPGDIVAGPGGSRIG